MNILIINGVNLSQLGTRETNVYGYTRFADYLSLLRKKFSDIDIQYIETESLADIVTAILHTPNVDGIVLNPGAYTHTSIVLADAIKAVPQRVVEVHISNLFGREQYRKHSFIAAACYGSIAGFGLKSYELAILSLLR